MQERKRKKQFQITRVVTRNIVIDSFQGIRNTFGLRMRGYESMLSKTLDTIVKEAFDKYPTIIWHRIIVNPITKGGVMIIVYGEYE